MSRQCHFVVFLAASFLVVVGLKYAQPFLVPVLFGAALAALSSPIATWVTRRGLPSAAGALAALVVDVALLAFLAVMLTLAGGELQEKLPAYVSKLSGVSQRLAEALTLRGIPVSPGALSGALHLDVVLGDAAASLAGAASTLVVVLVVVFFTLCEFTGVGDKLRGMLADPERGLVRVDRVMREIQKYMIVKTLTSFIVAALGFAVLKVFRVELALFLALVVFILHFIPNVGAAVGTLLAVLVALASRGPGPAVAVGIAFAVVNMVVGTVVEPRVLGRTLGLSPLFVLLSMLFWGWLWGAAGALLSVPLMMAGKIILENSRDLAWVARLLEPAPEAMEPTLVPGRAPTLSSLNPLLRRPSVPIGLGAATREPTVPR